MARLKGFRFSALFLSLCLCLSCRSSSPPESGSTNNTSSPPVATSQNSQATLPTLTEELEQFKQAGLPTTPEELQAPLPPSDQNAAPLYRQLDALWKAKHSEGDDKVATDGIGKKGQQLTAEQADKLRKAFQHRADIGNLIHKAVARPQCIFDRKWSEGGKMMFPEFAMLRMAARWLSSESALQLYDGKPLEAVQTEALGFRLALHAAQDPMLIAYLVAIAIDAITETGLERILYVAGDKPGVAEAVQRVVENAWQPLSLAYALRGEVSFQLVEVPRMRKEGPDAFERSLKEFAQPDSATKLPPLSPSDRQNWDQFMDRSEVVTLQSLRSLITAADKPYPEAYQSIQAIVNDLETHQQDASYILARTLFPVYEQSLEKRAQMQAKGVVLRAAAALFTWKVQHGSFPDKLDDALPYVPTDPWDEKALRYKKEGEGFIVYSVGPTGKFDGGTLEKKPDAMESLFRYPLPDYMR